MGRIGQTYARRDVQYTELRNARGVKAKPVHGWITAAMRHKATGGIIAFLSALGFIACVLILWRAT